LPPQWREDEEKKKYFCMFVGDCVMNFSVVFDIFDGFMNSR